MPRGQPGSSSKRQGLHNNHNHNGGLVQPKRPNRPRSASSAASVLPVASTNPPAVPEVSQAAAQFYSTPNGQNSDISTNGWHGKGQRFYDCLGDEGDGFSEGASSSNGMMGSSSEAHQKIDLNPNGGKSTDGYPATVLTSFPLLDTITLLIIFLQIPPTILTLIHSLFFLQTFVPPSTTLFSVSTSASMPSFTNFLLQGSNGSPSLLTIMFADCVLASISLFLWPTAWNFLIDFAQAIIAMTLGAGNSTGDSFRNVAVCAGVMGGVKVVQGRFRLSDAWDSIQPTRQSRIPQLLSGRHESATWLRTFFAIHILAQAVMKATRRWLIRRPESVDSTTTTTTLSVKDAATKQKDKDPEAAVGSSPPTTMERGDSTTGPGKRKKKSAIQSVRNNQPLWATMASAVIHIAKEVERTQLSSEASNTSTSVGAVSADTTSGEDSGVWITKIGSTDIGFMASLAACKDEGYSYAASGGNNAEPSTPTSSSPNNFPFFVRVNGIVWPQTEVTPIPRDLETATQDQEDEWQITVTGLTGSTEYDFEFVKKAGSVFYSTSACTLPAQAAASLPAPPNHQPSRPLSPVTTLLHSLQQARTTLTDSKTSLKSLRKAHKTSLSELRKEIEKHRSLLGNDRGEERAFRRNLALRESVKRAEEETDAMTKKLQELEKVPEKIKPEWEGKKKAWQSEKRKLQMAKEREKEEREKAVRAVAVVSAEATALQGKKEKLQARLSKLRSDLGRLDTEQVSGEDDKEKRAIERERREEERQQKEQTFLEMMQKLEAQRQEWLQQIPRNWNEVWNQELMVRQQEADRTQRERERERERSASIFSDGSVVTNLSELGPPTLLPAFAGFNQAGFGQGAREYIGMGIGTREEM